MRRSHLLPAVICFTVSVGGCFQTGAQSRPPLPGSRAVLVDERYAALRELPDLQGRIVQRLRRGRVLGLLGSTRNRRGERFHRVAISRKRSGWVYELAIIRTGNRRDGARMVGLIDEAGDDFTKIALARICQREFRGMEAAEAAGRSIAKAAPAVAAKLTGEVRRRIGGSPPIDRRAFFLSYAGLDRYNRIGVLFDYDKETDQLVFARLVRR